MAGSGKRFAENRPPEIFRPFSKKLPAVPVQQGKPWKGSTKNVSLVHSHPNRMREFFIAKCLAKKFRGNQFWRIEPVKMDFHYGTSLLAKSPARKRTKRLPARCDERRRHHASFLRARDEGSKKLWTFHRSNRGKAWHAKKRWRRSLYFYPAGLVGDRKAADDLLAPPPTAHAWRKIIKTPLFGPAAAENILVRRLPGRKIGKN